MIIVFASCFSVGRAPSVAAVRLWLQMVTPYTSLGMVTSEAGGFERQGFFPHRRWRRLIMRSNVHTFPVTVILSEVTIAVRPRTSSTWFRDNRMGPTSFPDDGDEPGSRKFHRRLLKLYKLLRFGLSRPSAASGVAPDSDMIPSLAPASFPNVPALIPGPPPTFPPTPILFFRHGDTHRRAGLTI